MSGIWVGILIDKTLCPRCLLWHGWLPALSACQRRGPWAVGAGDVAQYRVECALCSYSLDNFGKWDLPEGIDGDPLALALSERPDVWSDGSKVTNEVAHIDCVDAGAFARISGDAWIRRECGHMELVSQEEVLLLISVGCFVLSLVLHSLPAC